MAKKYGLVIDVTRCDGCGSCQLSVKDEYTYNNYPGYCATQPTDGVNWLWLKEVEQGHGSKIKMDYIPILYPHNRNLKASDIPGAPEGSVYVREDGLTIIDPEKAKGCKAIYEYFEKVAPGTVFWNEELQLPQTYILDAHRLDEGERLPRCAEDCPTQAMHWGDLNDPNSDVSKFIAEHPGEIEDYFQEEGADYVVRYYKLPKPFIAGEVMVCDSQDCVKGAKVTLTCKECGKVFETETDFFGDFEFKYLTRGNTYTIKAEVPGYKPKELTVVLDEAKNVDVITLEK
jgi:Fe-S-cluster-containing dehydrogenase component